MRQKYFIKRIVEGEDCRIAFIGYKFYMISISLGRYFFKFKKISIRKVIKKIIHKSFSNVHFLTGLNLIHVDNNWYPYCEICGAKPRSNFKQEYGNNS